MSEMRIVDQRGAWRGEFEERVRSGYQAVGCAEPLARALTERALKGVDAWTVATDGTGWAAVGVTRDNGTTVGHIHDLTAPGARSWAERWCAERGAQRVQVRLTGGAGGFADYPLRGQNRMRVAAQRPELPPGLTARPLTDEEYPDWYAGAEAAYLTDIVRAGTLTPEQAKEKSARDFARNLPQGHRTPGHAVYVLEAGGRTVGTGWVNHGFLPGVTFGFSLEVHEEHRGRGYGRAAMAVGDWVTRQGGDEALMFNVFGGNEIAMRLYDSAGFAVVDEWRSIDVTELTDRTDRADDTGPTDATDRPAARSSRPRTTAAPQPPGRTEP